MQDVIRFWAARGVDGFRVDALDRLMKDPDLRDDPPAEEAFALPVIGVEGRALTNRATARASATRSRRSGLPPAICSWSARSTCRPRSTRPTSSTSTPCSRSSSSTPGGTPPRWAGPSGGGSTSPPPPGAARRGFCLTTTSPGSRPAPVPRTRARPRCCCSPSRAPRSSTRERRSGRSTVPVQTRRSTASGATPRAIRCSGSRSRWPGSRPGRPGSLLSTRSSAASPPRRLIPTPCWRSCGTWSRCGRRSGKVCACSTRPPACSRSRAARTKSWPSTPRAARSPSQRPGEPLIATGPGAFQDGQIAPNAAVVLPAAEADGLATRGRG